jgi:protoporphyrinogen oxidase
MAEPRIAILGAGPTGLGAAWRLRELGHASWELFEAADHAGGLASSVVDENGFTWDLGGHVLFSHYPYFDSLMTAALGEDWLEHEREAWVRICSRWVPYPFQNNIWRLPENELWACLEGLLALQGRQAPASSRASFRDWLLQSFGTGLCELFMFPYNRKVWAYDPAELDVGWMGERVATVGLPLVLRNVVYRRDSLGWGPNATFRFPLRGGTGAIWTSVARQLPQEKLRFARRVVSVHAGARRITFADGTTTGYDQLVSTMPLDRLLIALEDQPDLAAQAARFVHSSTHVVGIGLEGSVPRDLRTRCWMYFPESSSPFYRATVFSNYSPNNVPRPGETWSLMCEVSESPRKPVDADRVVEETIRGCVASGLVEPGAPIVGTWHRRLEHGYPTPWLGRDRVLAPVNAALERLGIRSRGRFGGWKYEVSNQDHSVMQGVEAVDAILLGKPEPVYAAGA